MELIGQDPGRQAPLLPAGSSEASLFISVELKRLERVLHAYGSDDDAGGATAQVLLSEIESLRRFVLVPEPLKIELNAARSEGDTSLGQRLGGTLFSLIERIRGREFVITHAERLALDRTSRRAIGCLTFLASIDPAFVRRAGAH